MLDKHFNVAKNTPFERHCFRQMALTAGETVDKFVARFRLQAQHCSFADLEDQLRNPLVEKINPQHFVVARAVVHQTPRRPETRARVGSC